MKTYIVYINADEVGHIKAGSHNSAMKKAMKKYGPTQDSINQYIRLNPWCGQEMARLRLQSVVSVAYTEL